MAYRYAGDGLYRGLSTDVRPIAPAGYKYYSEDTYDMDVSDGTYWWASTDYMSPYSRRRLGLVPTGIAVVNPLIGMGMAASMNIATGGGTNSYTHDTTNGRYITFPTLTTTGNKGGYRSTTTPAQSTLGFNARMRAIFQIPTAGDHTLSRLFIGCTNNSAGELTGDDPLNAKIGVVFGFISGDSAFSVMHNDGTGATVTKTTGLGNIDTNIHTITIVGDNANSKWVYKYDNNAYQSITTDIPTVNQGVIFQFQIETNESGVAKRYRLYHLFAQSDK